MTESDEKKSYTAIEIAPISNPTQTNSHECREHDATNDHNASTQESTEDTNLVDWMGPDDPGMPVNWPKRRKVGIIAVVTASRLLTTLASSMMSPALLQIEAEFDGSSQVLTTFTVSIYALGYAVGPFILAPLSELYGRDPIYHAGNVLYTVTSAACALSPNIAALLAFRALAGLAGSVPATNAGGTIADMIPRERRGLINSIFGATLLLSPMLAPIAGGFMAEDMGWRWIFWIMTILSGATTIAGFCFLRETYTPILLQRKAARLRQETGNAMLIARGSAQVSLTQELAHTLRRPLYMLITSPIIIIGSLYLAFIYGVTVLLFTSMPLVFREVYGWSEGASGLSSLGNGIGCLISFLITGIYSDRIYMHLKEKTGEADQPESRLFFLIPAAITLPTGLLIYGWTTQFKMHWIAPMIGTGIFGMGMGFGFNGISSYMVDAFSIYAASALAANGLARGVTGALLPLSGPKLYEHLGYGWGNTLLGLLAGAIGGISAGLWVFGRDLRERYPVNLE